MLFLALSFLSVLPSLNLLAFLPLDSIGLPTGVVFHPLTLESAL
jgi:hypothetical protein